MQGTEKKEWENSLPLPPPRHKKIKSCFWASATIKQESQGICAGMHVPERVPSHQSTWVWHTPSHFPLHTATTVLQSTARAGDTCLCPQVSCRGVAE